MPFAPAVRRRREHDDGTAAGSGTGQQEAAAGSGLGGGGGTSSSSGPGSPRRCCVERCRSDARREDRLAAAESSGARREKRTVLIRHAQSTWNEFLHHNPGVEARETQGIGLRSALVSVVRRSPPGEEPMTPASPDEDPGEVVQITSSGPGGPQSRHRFWQGVRGGVTRVVKKVSHANKLHQADHQLTAKGIAEARDLRTHIRDICFKVDAESSADVASMASQESDGAPVQARRSGDIGPEQQCLLDCKLWFVSPFLRTLQTAAYALSPLHRRDPTGVRVKITPLANEMVKSSFVQDCQGKQGNVGFHIIARAISKTIETLVEDTGDEDQLGRISGELTRVRQQELDEVSGILCSMDLSEVSTVWWPDLGVLKKDSRQVQGPSRRGSKSSWLSVEDDRVRRLVGLLLQQEGDIVGLVSHSLLFQRMFQLFWPEDDWDLKEKLLGDLTEGMHAAGSTDGMADPLESKISNCGALVLTWSYREPLGGETTADWLDPRIIGAKFLRGHFERAVQGDGRGDVDSAGD